MSKLFPDIRARVEAYEHWNKLNPLNDISEGPTPDIKKLLEAIDIMSEVLQFYANLDILYWKSSEDREGCIDEEAKIILHKVRALSEGGEK